MPDQRTNENWRLEEGGKEADKWLLQESEQQVSDQWQLQQPPLEPINSWQPVEYVKAPRPAGTWILPTIITLALLVTLGYAGYKVLPALLNGETDPTPTVAGSAEVPDKPTPDPAVVAAETPAQVLTPVEPATPAQENVAPTPTLPAATPTQPSTLVTQEFATVNAEFGVNARFAPNTDAAIIRILENGETLFVFGQQGEWLEVFVADTPLTEGQPLSGTVGYAATEFLTVGTQEITAALRDQVLGYAGKLPTPTPEPTVAVVAPPPAESVPVTDTTAGTLVTPTAPILTVTINAIYGVNVRREPVADDANIIRLLENGTVLPAIGRSADNLWIQVTLPDAVSGWIAAEFLVPSADITTLPVVDATAVPGATPATPGAAPVDATGVVTSGIEPPPPYTSVIPSDSSPAIIVTVVDGVNARALPELEAEVTTVVPQGAVLPATGRSTDNQWVQVQLPTGVSAWIFRDTVEATPAVGALPAVGGPTPVPILLPTPTPNAAQPTPEAVAPTVEATATTAPESTTVTAKVIPFFVPVYSGPNNQSETVARSQRGADFVVIGQNADGSWLQVTTSDGVTGWVVAGNVRVTGDVTSVPVVE